MTLIKFSICNLGLYEKIDWEIGQGLNIVTGESGSGKSMLYSFIKFALGDKISYKMIRHGANHGSVDMTIEIDKKVYDIHRTINNENKIVNKINNKVVPSKELLTLLKNKIFITKQHEQLYFLDSRNLCELLDMYLDQEIIQDYKNKYQEYLTNYKELQNIQKNIISEDEHKNLLLKIEEFKEILNQDYGPMDIDHELKMLEEKEKILLAYNHIHQVLNNANFEKTILQNYMLIEKDKQNILDNLTQAFNVAKDAFYSDEGELYELQKKIAIYDNQLSKIYKIAKKYHLAIDEVNHYYNTLLANLDLHDSSNVLLSTYKNQLIISKKALEASASLLTSSREEVAKEVAKNLNEITIDLGMHMNLYFKIQNKTLDQSGQDDVNLYHQSPSENIDIAVKNIASGGELSRLLLALNSHNNLFDIYFFDEIDSGVSGRSAMMTGKHLHKLSSNHQVIVISHTPQVACFAKNLYCLSKKNNISNIVKLEDKQYARGIAKMLDGNNNSNTSIEHAQNLINEAQNIIYTN